MIENFEKTVTKADSDVGGLLLEKVNTESDYFGNDSLLNIDLSISDESIVNCNDIGISCYDSKEHDLSNTACTNNVSNKKVDDKYSVTGDNHDEDCIENIDLRQTSFKM